MFYKIMRPLVSALLAILALLVIFIPDGNWPQEWVRYRGYKGEFEGKPIVLNPPLIRQDSATLTYSIKMSKGVCRLSFISPDGDITHHTTMGSGYVRRATIASGDQLLLDPGPDSGNYSVGMGLKYHVLSPFLWRCFSYGILVGMILSVFMKKDKQAWLQSLKNLFTTRQWVVTIILAVLTSLILYPLIHESGHALTGMLLGGDVREIVFTPLSGETPHVSFEYVPEGVGPIMNAGGVFLPILCAYCLFLIWFVIRKRLSRFMNVLLLVLVVLLLFPGVFTFDDHLRGMAMQMGYTGQVGIIMVKTIPAWFAFFIYAVLGWLLWRKRTGQ